MKFKVGDKVRCIDDSPPRPELSFGGVYTVTKASTHHVVVEGSSIAWAVHRFELVESELERLVRVANEGRRAQEVLVQRYREQVEYWDDEQNSDVYTYPAAPGVEPARVVMGSEIRIKPAPKRPDPITIGPGWEVELSDRRKTIRIGCQAFDALWLRIGLAGLCQQGITQSDGMAPLVATRSGVRHSGHEISWADADRLLAWLEEALK